MTHPNNVEPVDRDPTITRIALGPYRPLQLIGRGGMARVYRCADTRSGAIVAVKLVKQTQRIEEDVLRRFEREIQAMKRVLHPYIVKLLDYSLSPEKSYLVMPYFAGGSVADRLAQQLYTPREVAQMLTHLAFALDYAHNQGYIHRDIKPSNILLDDQGQTYLSDFGLAKSLQASSVLTGTGQLFGTFAYMAPEIMDGAPADVRTDVYAMGILLCELLAGHRPFNTDNPVAYAYLHRRAMPPSLSQLNPTVPAVLNPIVLSALEKSPRNRPQSAGELARLFATAVNTNRQIADIRAPIQPRPELMLIPVKGVTSPLEPASLNPAPQTRQLNLEELEEPARQVSGSTGSETALMLALVIVVGVLLLVVIAVLTRR
ncbi:MAG TPA: serine/threonine-protein kinase [Aggregatilineales bacterium]|nr:serine/threonine-protein kinase [Aggregatilineales bacterium]